MMSAMLSCKLLTTMLVASSSCWHHCRLATAWWSPVRVAHKLPQLLVLIFNLPSGLRLNLQQQQRKESGVMQLIHFTQLMTVSGSCRLVTISVCRHALDMLQLLCLGVQLLNTALL
jgi:hypothetical protein